MAKPTSFNLSDMIELAADELRKARTNLRDLDPVMQFGGCEIELAVNVKAEAGGGLKFWIVDASAKAGRETVSKIKLSFGPAAGTPVLQFLQGGGELDPGPPNPKLRKRR